MNWLYLKAGDIAFKDNVLEQLHNARSPLWESSERGLAKLMHKLGPALGLWGDAFLWLDMVGKLRVYSR